MGRDRVTEAIRAFREGRAVILQDDPDRENEGDLIIAAEMISEEIMAMMIRECSGIVCLCIEDDLARRLELPQMVERNENNHGTAFTVSIEARRGITTGVSAHDRVATIRAAIHPGARPDHLARPGHVFPLRAAENGVLGREGHTEGSIDLAIMAGFKPAAILSELTNPDGTMTKGEQIQQFAEKHRMVILSIQELIERRRSAQKN